MTPTASRPARAPTTRTRGRPSERRRRDWSSHGVPPAAHARHGPPLRFPGARARRAAQRADRAALPPPRTAGRRGGDLPGRAAGGRARGPGRRGHDHFPGALRGHRQAQRRGVRRQAGALRRHARRPRGPPLASASPWRSRPPVWPRPSAWSPRRCGPRPSPRARSSASSATASTRSRTSGPTRRAAPPSSSPRSCSRPTPGCPGRAWAPRRRSGGSTRPPCAPFLRRTSARPPRRPSWSATSPASTWTRCLRRPSATGRATPDSPGRCRRSPRTTPARVVIVDRPGAVHTELLIGRIGADRHERVWPAQVLGTYCLGGTLTSLARPGRCARRRATPTGCAPSPRCCAPPAPTRPAPPCSRSAARWTRSPPDRRWTTSGRSCGRWPPRG
ncbi:hypothetical protein SCALM49S_01927 [Streptomyces californicus]